MQTAIVILFLNQTYDCNGIFSRECYEDWLNSRQKTPKHPEESYRRALIGHVTGDSRRKPFPPEIESCVLERLREKKVWECFKQDEESTTRIGAQGEGQSFKFLFVSSLILY